MDLGPLARIHRRVQDSLSSVSTLVMLQEITFVDERLGTLGACVRSVGSRLPFPGDHVRLLRVRLETIES